MNPKCFKRSELRRLIRLRAPGFESAMKPAIYWISEPYVVVDRDHPAWLAAEARFGIPPAGPIPRDLWPDFARALVGWSTRTDAGLGDVVGRSAAELRDDSIVRLFFRRLLAGPFPSCPLEVLNARFPIARDVTRAV